MKKLFINILKTIALPFIFSYAIVFLIFQITGEAFDGTINLFKN